MIHRKKNRPAFQRRDILAVSLVSFFLFLFCIGNLFRSFSSTQFFHPVLSGCVPYSIPYISVLFKKHFFLELFVRSLSTQLLFLVVLLLLLFSMIAFSYVGRLSLFWVRLFHAVFPDPSSTQLLSWVVVFWPVCRTRIRSVVSLFSSGSFFGLPVFRGSVLGNF